MKKTAIILAALLAAFLVTGCDQVLETLYPEFKQEAGGENGAIIVDLEFTNDLVFNYGGDFGAGQAKIAVGLVPFMYKSDGYGVDDRNIQIQYATKQDFIMEGGRPNPHKVFKFYPNVGATYKVIAWLERKPNDDKPANPNSTSGNQDEPSTLILTENGDFSLDLQYHRGNDPAIRMWGKLSPGMQVDWNQFMADPSDSGTGGGGAVPEVFIEVPFTDTPVGTGINFFANGFDEDGYIVEREWKVFENWMQEIPPNFEFTEGFSRFFGMQNLFYTFNMQGKACVAVRVRDNDGNWSGWGWVFINVMSQGYDPLPYVSIGASNLNPTVGETVSFFNYSSDNDAFGLYRPTGDPANQYLWLVDGTPYSTDPWPPGYIFNTAGNHEVRLEMWDSAGQYVSSSPLYFNVGGIGQTPGQPFEVPFAFDQPFYNYVAYQQSQYIHFYGLDEFLPYTLMFSGLNSDVDIFIYSDPGFTNQITSSTVGGIADEPFAIGPGYSQIFVRIYGYQAGNYTLSFPAM